MACKCVYFRSGAVRRIFASPKVQCVHTACHIWGHTRLLWNLVLVLSAALQGSIVIPGVWMRKQAQSDLTLTLQLPTDSWNLELGTLRPSSLFPSVTANLSLFSPVKPGTWMSGASDDCSDE